MCLHARVHRFDLYISCLWICTYSRLQLCFWLIGSLINSRIKLIHRSLHVHGSVRLLPRWYGHATTTVDDSPDQREWRAVPDVLVQHVRAAHRYTERISDVTIYFRSDRLESLKQPIMYELFASMFFAILPDIRLPHTCPIVNPYFWTTHIPFEDCIRLIYI
jgi:hypothetical protein